MYKAALDVFYNNDTARAVCFLFEDWAATQPCKIYSTMLPTSADYKAGAFYKRELPCLLSVLQLVDLSELEVVIIDGYVFLDDNNTLGLGGHLYKALWETLPVIGVAKTRFHNNTRNVIEAYRGTSLKPLYITAIGVDHAAAALYVKSMSGSYRIPDLLKMLDRKTREYS